MWKGWRSPGVVGKMLAWLLMVVHAQGANTALPVGLKILTFLWRSMDEKVINLSQKLLQPGGGFSSVSDF